MIQERLRKQDILLATVRVHKVSPSDILQALEKSKPENFNIIDAWTYQDLYDVLKQLVVEKVVVKSQVQEEQTQENLNQSIFYINDENQYRETIKCRRVEENLLVRYFNDNPLTILQPKIKEYKIVDEGTFTPNYVSYKIELSEFDCIVWRRFECFYWLQEQLTLIYPDCLIPPLPAKTFIRKFRPNHLSKRSRMLEQFLSAILSNQLLRSSELVEGFLLTNDDVKYQQLVLASQALKKPVKISEFLNTSGEFQIEYNHFDNQYFIDMNNYLTHTNDVYKDLTNSSRVMVDSMNDFTQKVGFMIGNVTRMKEQTVEFNKKTRIGNLFMLEQVYSFLERYLTDWNQSLIGLSKVVNENFYEFFRFQRDMQNRCHELIKQRNNTQSQFLKENQDLLKKKYKYYSSEPIEKWQLSTELDRVKIQANKELAIQLMFPQQTQQVKDLQQRYAFINKQAYEQITEYFDNKTVVYSTRLAQMSKMKKVHAQEQAQIIDDISQSIQKILQLREGKYDDVQQEWIDIFNQDILISNIIQ
ncbi:hypothetical protein pb186bvf_003525 [Paramecium bursaria]